MNTCDYLDIITSTSEWCRMQLKYKWQRILECSYCQHRLYKILRVLASSDLQAYILLSWSDLTEELLLTEKRIVTFVCVLLLMMTVDKICSKWSFCKSNREKKKKVFYVWDIQRVESWFAGTLPHFVYSSHGVNI